MPFEPVLTANPRRATVLFRKLYDDVTNVRRKIGEIALVSFLFL
jgi:hypothetical protein